MPPSVYIERYGNRGGGGVSSPTREAATRTSEQERFRATIYDRGCARLDRMGGREGGSLNICAKVPADMLTLAVQRMHALQATRGALKDGEGQWGCARRECQGTVKRVRELPQRR